MPRILTGLLLLTLVVLASNCVHDPVIPEGWPPEPPIPPDTGTVTPIDTCDPDSTYFLNDILPLLNAHCGISGCHDPASASDGVILTEYSLIISTADVDPGDPGGSDLYDVITETDPDKMMPPPGSGIDPLTAAEIALIFDWISQGAQENGCDGACDTTSVTLSGSVRPILELHCTGCHSGASPQGGISLVNYSDIKARADDGSLLGSISHDVAWSAMPKNQDKLPDCKIATIRIWIEDGAPDN